MAPAPLPTALLALAPADELARRAAALAGAADTVLAEGEAEAAALLAEHDVQAVICGPEAPERCGAFLGHLQRNWPETPVILIRNAGEGRASPRAGIGEGGHVHALLPDPVTPSELRIAVEGACRAFRLARENARLTLERRLAAPDPAARRRAAVEDGGAFDAILRAAGSPMNALIERAAQLASFDVPVVIRSEPACGQVELAHGIHRTSLRSDRPFHALDCAGLPDEALQLELFGARHGALPGLAASRTGLAQRAHRGTLYLDRVELLSPAMQLALMRMIDEGLARPLGSTEAQPAAPRMIAGTRVDLAAEVAAGRFRSDLHYALAVTEIEVPPLRDRPMDLGLIASDMLVEASRLHAKPVRGFTPDALAFLARHAWPGNLRELENEITRMLIAADAPLLGADLISRQILQQSRTGCPTDTDRTDAAIMTGEGTLRDRVEAIEARILTETLTRLKWNKSRAAVELGLSRVGLRAKLDRYGLSPPEGRTARAPATMQEES